MIGAALARDQVDARSCVWTGMRQGFRQHDTHRGPARQGWARRFPVHALGLHVIIVPGTQRAAYLDHAVTLARGVQRCGLE
jgi:hypothetical protein